MPLPRLTLFSVCIAAAAGAGTRDAPILGDGGVAQYLDGEAWSVLTTAGVTLPQPIVPGDLLTDMQVNGLLGDPLYELNFRPETLPPIWDDGNTTYTCTFTPSSAITSASNALLVFDGVKMAADVYLNGVSISGAAGLNDQFLRYSFAVSSLLKAGVANTLTVVFTTSSDPRNAQARFAGCTGGWDWAFYTQTYTSAGSRTFSKGIWKSVYLIPAAAPAVTYVVPHVYYNGSYPTAPLNDSTAAPFTVSVRTHFSAAAAGGGVLSVTGNWPGVVPSTQSIALPAGDSSFNVSLPAAGVSLWWLNGMGPQTLYNVTVTWTPTGGAAVTTTRRIGFRVLYLVTGNDTDPSTMEGKDGSADFTMRFKVNGADVYARGGNIIPMEEMEGRFSGDAYAQLVDHAADANMNWFRVWGGGIYGFDAFYDRADERGIAMYHDMMFAGDGRVNPYGNQLENDELRHQLRRLSHHPSIAMWDSCNECGAGGIWDSFVATTIASEDTSRPVWPSCPAMGWTSGVDMLTGLPNGNPLVSRQPAAGSATMFPTSNLNPAPTQTLVSLPCVGASTTCTQQPGIDYDTGYVGKTVAAATPQDCCDACAADPTNCWAGSWWNGICYFKPAGKTSTYNNNGVVSVFPPGSTPPTPLPPTRTIEVHGPYQHGSGFPSVNGANDLEPISPNLPPSLAAVQPSGPAYPGLFASEFGMSVWSSFESMTGTLDVTHWGLHGNQAPDNCTGGIFGKTCTGGNTLAERNYPCDSFIVSYFGTGPNLSATGVKAFQSQLYMCTVSQLLEHKGDIEGRRSDLQWGTIYWQLNEIWPTGGWGSLEYGTIGYTPGQVLGGRWKPTHHMVASHLYRDQITACGGDGRCYIRNDDALSPFLGTLSLNLVHLATGVINNIQNVSVNLPRGGCAIGWTCMNGTNPSACPSAATVLTAFGCAGNGSDCILVSTLTNAAGAVVDNNIGLQTAPMNLQLPAGVSVTATPGAQAPDGSVPVTLSSTGVAVYVHLITQAQGHFSDNMLLLVPGAPVVVTFLPLSTGAVPMDYAVFMSTLRVEHMGMYI